MLLFVDGIYLDQTDSNARFQWVKPPTSAELTQVTHTIAHRVGCFLERKDLDVAVAKDQADDLIALR
ncbi:MAG: hypothetical protein ACI9FD_002931 [Gammaproteobacteria bacterium]|jgi:hypothetical protein